MTRVTGGGGYSFGPLSDPGITFRGGIAATTPMPLGSGHIVLMKTMRFAVVLPRPTGDADCTRGDALWIIATAPLPIGSVAASVLAILKPPTVAPPAVPSYADADMLQAMLQLMPRGRAWPLGDPSSNIVQTLAALVPLFTELCNNAAGLITDAFPAFTVMSLSEWQASLGLPDPCTGPEPTLQQSQGQVAARFAGLGGQSIKWIIGYAANLGFVVTVKEFLAFTCGVSTVGTPLYGEAWNYALEINSKLQTITYFRTGQSTAGEPLEAFGNAELECELARLAPAQAVLIFSYS